MWKAPDMSILGVYSCGDSVADYCATRACPSDVPAAEAACQTDMEHHFDVETRQCGSFTLVDVYGVDTQNAWVYDASGQLVALLGMLNLDPETCFAGPAQLTIPACALPTTICLRARSALSGSSGSRL